MSRPVKIGLYVGSVTIVPPNTRPTWSAREMRQTYDAKQNSLKQWYEAMGLGWEYRTV